MSIKYSIITLLFFLTTKMVYTQDKYNTWYQYMMSAKLDNKKNFTALAQYRTFDLGSDPRVFLLGSYIDIEATNKIKPAVGLMYLNLNSYTSSGSKKMRHEIRPIQQVTINTDIKRFGVSHRFRAEERFLSNPDAFILRFRYLLSLRIPFDKAEGKGLFHGVLKNEIRLNAKKDDVFDSDRITVGIGAKISDTFSIELSVIDQLDAKSSAYYMFIGLRNRFDWRKDK